MILKNYGSDGFQGGPREKQELQGESAEESKN